MTNSAMNELLVAVLVAMLGAALLGGGYLIYSMHRRLFRVRARQYLQQDQLSRLTDQLVQLRSEVAQLESDMMDVTSVQRAVSRSPAHRAQQRDAISQADTQRFGRLPTIPLQPPPDE